MDRPLNWLHDAMDTPWSRLAEALRLGLLVPNGFIAGMHEPERNIRTAYEELGNYIFDSLVIVVS
jgi:hypothetical protein